MRTRLVLRNCEGLERITTEEILNCRIEFDEVIDEQFSLLDHPITNREKIVELRQRARQLDERVDLLFSKFVSELEAEMVVQDRAPIDETETERMDHWLHLILDSRPSTKMGRRIFDV